MAQDISQVDQTKFNIGIDITQRISQCLRKSDECYTIRDPIGMKLFLDNVYRMIALYIPDMSIQFQENFTKLKLTIDMHVKTLLYLKNKVNENKKTSDRIAYDQLLYHLLDECQIYDLMLTEVRQLKGLNLPDKPNPGKAMLNISGR